MITIDHTPRGSPAVGEPIHPSSAAFSPDRAVQWGVADHANLSDKHFNETKVEGDVVFEVINGQWENFMSGRFLSHSMWAQ